MNVEEVKELFKEGEHCSYSSIGKWMVDDVHKIRVLDQFVKMVAESAIMKPGTGRPPTGQHVLEHLADRFCQCHLVAKAIVEGLQRGFET